MFPAPGKLAGKLVFPLGESKPVETFTNCLPPALKYEIEAVAVL